MNVNSDAADDGNNDAAVDVNSDVYQEL